MQKKPSFQTMKYYRIILNIVILLLAYIFVTGCATTNNNYSEQQQQQLQQMQSARAQVNTMKYYAIGQSLSTPKVVAVPTMR